MSVILRRRRVLEIVRKRGWSTAVLDELAAELGVNARTIRRDRDALAADGLLVPGCKGTVPTPTPVRTTRPPAPEFGVAGVVPEVVQKLASSTATAAQAIGELVPGGWVCGLTRGQFSLIDLIRAVLDQVGPATVDLSTWSSGIRDSETARWLIDNGQIRRLRFVVDQSFGSRKPKWCARLCQLFGEEAMIVTRVHAKIAVIRNEHWNVVVRSSMNLNRNPRFEQFDVTDSVELADFFGGWVDDLAETAPRGPQFNRPQMEAAFRAALEHGVAVDDAVSEMLGETPEDRAKREAREAKAEAKVAAEAAKERRARELERASALDSGSKPDFLKRLQRVSLRAESNDNHGAAVAALKLEGRCLGYDRPPPIEVDPPPPPSGATEHRAELLSHFRRLSARAEAEGSYVAAANARRAEADLLKTMPGGEDDPMAGMGDDEVIAGILAALAGLPDSLKSRVLSQLQPAGVH